MRDLTSIEINNAPRWAIEYSIDCDDDISWIGRDKVLLNGDTGLPTLITNVSGFFECVKIIPINEKQRREQTLADIKQILTDCKPGLEAEAILCAIQLNRITDITWSNK